VLFHGWQTIPEKGVVRSCKPFKFWWAPTISLERLIVSGAVNLSPVHTSNNVEATLLKQQATLLLCCLLLRQCCRFGQQCRSNIRPCRKDEISTQSRSTLLSFLATKSNVASTLLPKTATLSKQHSTLLLRHCCWCGPGFSSPVSVIQCKCMMVVGQLLITPTVEIFILQLGRVEEMV